MTTQLYYATPYETESVTIVRSVERKNNNAIVELEATIFYPQGGGQPSDVGEIKGPNGNIKVEFVQFKDGRIVHQGKLFGELETGDEVKIAIKWSHRHHSMRNHTAGHLIHEGMVALAPAALVPVKVNHGSSAFIEYDGDWPDANQAVLEAEVNQLIAADLPVEMREATIEEIQTNCRHVPKGLPTGKPLRTVRIGKGELVPCGGTHVSSLREVGKIVITRVETGSGTTKVVYRITAGAGTERMPRAAEACLGGA